MMHRRDTVLYVTIDPFDHRTDSGAMRGHMPNLSRVTEAAASWSSGAIVRDLWCGHLSEAVLDDPDLLALFLSGSYTDWVEAFRELAWLQVLDQFCGHIRQTRVPILAVCGSHQLVAYVFGGWEAVGHMAAAGETPLAIAGERDGVARAPIPRIGEVGAFRYLREADDPLFAGLTDEPGAPLVFSQWHMDQVMPQAIRSADKTPDTNSQFDLSGERLDKMERGEPSQTAAHSKRVLLPAASLLRPAGLAGARLLDDFASGAEGAVRRHIAADDECCVVQALRYAVQPAGRILYTTQFHPDLAGSDADGVQDHGVNLLHKFLDIAAGYWFARRVTC